MRKAALAALAAAAVLAGCGSSAANTPQAHRAEAVVEQCLHAGAPRQIVHCVAPSGHGLAFATCAIKRFFADQPLALKSRRDKLFTDLATCAEANR